jgi:succinate-semialdehyde dehydrogenase/glutarate-semialdehyde dehydrogenase
MAQPQATLDQDNRETVDTYNPATGNIHKTYIMHNEDDLNEITERAHKAFLKWRTTSFEERAKILNKAADIVERDKQELAKMMAKQMGKPVKQGIAEAELCAQILRYTAEEGPKVLADEERDVEGHKKGIISYQPLGVILGMQPWNFPLYQCMRYSCAVIMAGNTTVFKHATICLETAFRIQKIYEEAGLPEDVFSIIYAGGKEADKLISHDKVRGVTFTGSESVGRIVAEMSGENLKKTVMELGGSDPYFVLDDADIDKAVEICVWGRINNGGQTCIAAKRFFIHAAIYDEFKEKFVKAMSDVSYGDPLDENNDMGPMCTIDNRDELHEQVKETLEKGATLLCGGEIPDGNGAFYPATVLEDISEGSPAYDDELFGPVASLFKFDNLDEAIEVANGHKYGLGGGVISGDEDKAIAICRDRLDTGILNVNCYGPAKPNMPFGGVKDSGYGREHGGFGLREFVNIKSISVGK